MRLTVALVTALTVFFAVACSSSGGREQLLRETVTDYFEAWQDRDPRAYDFNHQTYKEIQVRI